MRYLSVCSGIEAATVAWRPLGWQPIAYSEIEPFPCSVLEHHYPDTPNLGDMERFHEWPDANVDVLVGGTPCQSFSVSGLRQGLDDPRGNLALTYLAIAERYRPRWLIWENVPGVLSIDEGRAMGSLLGGLAKLGYGFAYRVLDAQFFGVAQRRRRVFVVAHYGGNWRAAAAVLFESSSLRWDPPPIRETGSDVAGCLTQGLGTRGGIRAGADEAAARHMIPEVAHSLRADGFDASEDGTGRGTPRVLDVSAPITTKPYADNEAQESRLIVMAHGQGGAEISTDGIGPTLTCNHEAPITTLPFDTTQITHPENRSNPQPGDPAPSLARGGHAPAVAFNNYPTSGQGAELQATEARIASAINSAQLERTADRGTRVLGTTGVRRLTPRECERLQGFPDDYTLIPTEKARKVEADWLAYIRQAYPDMTEPEARRLSKDGPRYKALGNSFAVPVIKWVGRRIALAEEVFA